MGKARKINTRATPFVAYVPETPIFVNEHLTPKLSSYCTRARKLKDKGFTFVWPNDWKIFVKKLPVKVIKLRANVGKL